MKRKTLTRSSTTHMKIGIFDSGLGGLLLLKAVRRTLPEYDYIYLGDTKRVPYGNRTPETIYAWTREAVEYLFKYNCQLIILGCNTASVEALRRLQQEYLPKHYPDRRILGMVVPTIEAALASQSNRVGIIGTAATVTSNVYKKELRKQSRHTHIFQKPTPLLVPFIESNETPLIVPALQHYLSPLLHKHIDSLILGCTHYSKLKREIRKLVGAQVHVISQDEVIPTKLKQYLIKHPELSSILSKRGTIELFVTERTPIYTELAKKWFGKTQLREITL